jgi:hypothetical protein
MLKHLPDADFRSRREVLVRGDFAYAPKPEPPPSDAVHKEIWRSIVTLPDDVAVRTSNYHGTALKQLHELWGAWVESRGAVNKSLAIAMLDAGDDFQSATYTALTGFYRLSIAALRSALELVAIGTWAEVCHSDREFQGWRDGTAILSFANACDGLVSATNSLRRKLRDAVADSLFDQKDSTSEGGFARRIFSGISDFSHSRPGRTDGDMRDSNGPIYVRSAFEHAAWIHFEVIALCFVLVLIARPKLDVPPPVIGLFNDGARVQSRVTHADESLRDQLEMHLSSLRRQGIIASWRDRRIAAGTEIGPAIDSHIDTADIILLLISPDFIASDYCYEREMKRALERHESRKARVIPVILRPCDWHDLPFGKLLATPTDGRPVTMWPNSDQAFLEVVKAIKRSLAELGQNAKPVALRSANVSHATQEGARSSNLRVKKQFTDLDKDRFRHEGFEYMAKYFENSLEELVRRNRGLDRAFRRVDANRFTAVAYRDGEKVCRGSVSIGSGPMGDGGIQYSMTDEPLHGGMNEAVYVKNDDQAIYFEILGMQSYGERGEKLTFEGAAELFWKLFIRPLQS